MTKGPTDGRPQIVGDDDDHQTPPEKVPRNDDDGACRRRADGFGHDQGRTGITPPLGVLWVKQK